MKTLIPKFILEKSQDNKLNGNFQATTMFIDISGFTAMTQDLMKNGKEGAEILSEIINEIYTPSIKAVYDKYGFISTFAGDAFTSIFPYRDCKPIFALNAAQHIQEIFSRIGKQKTKFGVFDLSIKIGLSYGTVNWGIIQSDKLKSYYFKGNAIDNCAECEQNAKKGEIIFDEAVLLKIQNKVEFENKSKNYFLLKFILNVDKQKLQKKSIKQLPQTDFITESILKLKTKGEFRDIISCFISFEENKNWKQAISKIMNLSQTYGGYFNKIDFGDKGGNVLVLFGAPVGKEKIYSRACGFALAVKNIPNLNTRIGLTYGTVFSGFVGSKLREEYTALGMVVNLSARFMMKAGFGEIYIDKFIQKNIKKRYKTNELTEQQFKGFKEKIPVYTLEKKIEHKFVYEGKLIGRQKELQKLKRTLKPIQNGRFGGIVYVHGIAGIGKSRLVNELKEEGERKKEKGEKWFYLPCDEILRKSFNPFTHFLKHYFEQSEENTKQINKSNFESKLENIIKQTKDKDIKSGLIRTRSILGVMINLTWKNSLFEQLNAKGRYENTLYAIKNLIKAESLQKPVIIELEDGHWIDSDSKKLLEVLTINVEKFPFIVFSACRLKDDGSLFNFDFKEVPQKNIILEYLEKESSRKLIENKLNGQVSEKLFSLIWQKSEGNPFYIEQIVLYLQENELIDEKLILTKKEIEIPQTINSIIVARIDRLTTELKELVQTASVLGREFAINILSAMLNRKEINKELIEGEKENIWNALTQINYIFKHALIRETVYEMQLKKQLRKLHKLAAKTIENIYKKDLKEFYGELANHYEKAEIKDKTIEFLQKAGNFAKENYKNEQAFGFYEKLLKQQVNIELRIDILIKKGDILELIGKLKEAEETFRKSLTLSEKIEDQKRIAESSNSLGWQFFIKGNYVKAMAYYEKSLEIFEELGNRIGISKAINNIGLVHYNQGNYDKAMEYLENELNICEEIGDKKGISAAINNMGVVHYIQGNYDRAMECFEKKLKISEEIGDIKGISSTINNMGLIYRGQGNYDKAMKCYEKALKIDKELGNKSGISHEFRNMGLIYHDQGNYSKAMEYHDKDLNICEELGSKSEISAGIGNMGNVYYCQDNYAKAMECYEKQLIICEELGNKRGIALAVGNMGSIYAYQGFYKKGMECFEKKLKISEELGDKKEISVTVENIGHIYKNQGNYEKAMRFYKKQLIIYEELGNKRGIALAVDNIGNVYSNQGNYKKAMECYEKALEIDREFYFKSHLINHLSDEAECLNKMQEYSKAREFNEKCYIAAKELDDKSHIFSSEVLKEKINFKQSDDYQKNLQSIENLKILLKDEKEEKNIAALNYEIALMLNEIKKENSEYKKKAISIYKKLYKKTPKIEYKNKYEELEKLL
ncbi:MAG: tetratricopeptide repeat protein [Candidatus Cloacimonetes bacterium]|nr:tetratricopeptide repeat protein [Candidatus Cloacimonadota bacterium]